MNFTHTASDYVFELHRGLPAGGPDREPEQTKAISLADHTILQICKPLYQQQTHISWNIHYF